MSLSEKIHHFKCHLFHLSSVIFVCKDGMKSPGEQNYIVLVPELLLRYLGCDLSESMEIKLFSAHDIDKLKNSCLPTLLYQNRYQLVN